MNQVKENSEERAYRVIAEALIKFYKPGDYLFESSLSHELDMSRTPIAIALNRLVSEGLLKKQPKKGCYIPRINLKDAHDVFGMRRVLEIEAMRLVVAQKDENIVATLSVNIDKTILAVRCDDFESFDSMDLEFHNYLVVSTQNEYLYEAWKRVFMRCNMYCRYFSNNLKQNQFLKENLLQDHCEMVEAIKNNDVDSATMCINTHFDNIVSYAVDSALVYDNV